MNVHEPRTIRNVALVGHSGAGKTTLNEALLFAAGAITRMGKVEDGNTVSDHDAEEVRRGISVSLSLAPIEWEGVKINLLDAPGYADFIGDVMGALRAADACLFVVSAVDGVAEGDDSLLEKYLDAGELSGEEIVQGVKAGLADAKFAPVLVGAAARPIGVDRLASFIAEAFPSPADRPPVTALAKGDAERE